MGDVVVCDGLDAALAAHARDASGARFVTEDGCGEMCIRDRLGGTYARYYEMQFGRPSEGL